MAGPRRRARTGETAGIAPADIFLRPASLFTISTRLVCDGRESTFKVSQSVTRPARWRGARPDVSSEVSKRRVI